MARFLQLRDRRVVLERKSEGVPLQHGIGRGRNPLNHGFWGGQPRVPPARAPPRAPARAARATGPKLISNVKRSRFLCWDSYEEAGPETSPGVWRSRILG